MANKPLKSIKYPGLSDTYTFVQIGTEAGQAADAGETWKQTTDLKSTINHIADSLEAVNGDVAIESEKWEIGGINFSESGWTYGANNKRIRTKEGFAYVLNEGDVVGLTDYTGKSFSLGILKSDDTYGYTGTLQSDYIVTTANEGQYAIVVRNTTEVALSSVEELLQYVKITRAESTISDIKSDMAMIDNTVGENIVTDSTKSSNTHNGITFTPQKDGGYKVTGTATNTAIRNLYSSMSALPSWLKKGKQYYVTFKSDNVQLRFLPNGGGSTVSLVNTKTNTSFFIPDDTVGVTVRLVVNNGTTVNEVVYPIITEVETPNLSEHSLQKNNLNTYTYESAVKTATGNLIRVDDVNPCSLLRISGAGTNDITVCGKNIYRNPHGMTTYTQNGVTKTFSENNGSIRVQSSGATNTSVYPNPVTTVNGVSFACLFKFSLPVDHVVTFSDNASRDIYMYDLVYMEISDGTNTTKLRGNPVTLLCKANVEYGVRIHADTGYSGDVTFYPQIELNGFATDFQKFCGAYRESGTVVSLNQRGTSPNNITADGNIATVISPSASVTLEYDSITKSNRANCGYYKEVENVGNKPKMLSFIDDDTTNLSLVQLYHDTLEDIGIVGNYAVITSHLSNDNSLKEELLSYEAEGYGMLLHVNEQNGEGTDYFRPGTLRNFDACRQNLITGLRAMHNFGFLSGDNWVSPYGVNDPDLQGLAKSLNLKCLVSTLNNTPVIHNKTNRYSIPRYSLAASFNIDIVKRGLEACENGGWVLITTHANEWGNDTETIATKISDIVTYAESIGFSVVNFEEGFKTFFLT